MSSPTRPALRLLTGGRADRSDGDTRARAILHPTTPLARRAGITAVSIPDDMYVSPSLVRAMGPRRLLSAVA